MKQLEQIRVVIVGSDFVSELLKSQLTFLGAQLLPYPTPLHLVDVLVYSLSQLEIPEDVLIQDYPKLILAEYSTFGSHSLWAKQVATDEEAQCLSGLTLLSGNQSESLQSLPFHLASYTCAQYILQGIYAALYRRASQGISSKVSTSMMESLLTFQNEMITTSINHDYCAPLRAKQGNAHAYLPAPYGVYQTSDGYFALSIIPMQRLNQVLQLDLPAHYLSEAGGFDYRDEIMQQLACLFKTQSNAYWLGRFEPLDIWCAAFQSYQDLLAHPTYGNLSYPFDYQEGITDAFARKMTSRGLPLKGVTVVDLSQYLSAPSATLQLADLGATVIKVEHPLHGEAGRGIIFDQLRMDGDSTEYLAINRNKLGFAADLKDPAQLAQVLELIREADVVVQNFRPKVIKRFGLGYEQLQKINPHLIYADISGYGEQGCWSNKPGQDLIIQALSGIAWGNPQQAPQPIGLAVVDLFAGIHLVQGVLTALYHRQQTGKGGHLACTMLGGASYFLSLCPRVEPQETPDAWGWKELFYSPYGQSLKMIQTVRRPQGYQYQTLRCPIRWDNQILYAPLGAPEIGEHQAQIEDQYLTLYHTT